MPGLFASVGVQGIATGNPGYSVTAEKNLSVKEGQFNVFGGVGFRSNEEHLHGVGGAKFAFPSGWTIGLQLDGHQRNPFVTYGRNGAILGVYLIDGKDPAYMAGLRF